MKLCYPDSLKTARPFYHLDFSFQQDGAVAHTAKLVQDFLATNYSEFTDKYPSVTHFLGEFPGFGLALVHDVVVPEA